MPTNKTPPPFKLLKARKGQAIAHLLVSVDLKGRTSLYEPNSYDFKDLGDYVTRARVDDVDAEVYYVPIVLPIPKKARPVKTAKAKAKKIAKPKQAKVDTKQEAPVKKSRAKKATRTTESSPPPKDVDNNDGF